MVERTSHYLIFVTKNKTAFSIMKEIMGKESSSSKKGVPSFKYSPPTTHKQLSLFDDFDDDFQELKTALLNEFAGQTMTMLEVYERHHIGKRYIKKNYKDALREMEQEGKIVTERCKRAKKDTMGDTVKITFLPKQ